jgi:hypothetical protein
MKNILLAIIVITCFSVVLAQTMTEVKAKDLPRAIEKYINDNLPGGKIYKAVKVYDKGVMTYNVAIDLKGHKYVYIFNKDGKFLKKGDDQAKPSVKATVKKGNGQNNPSLKKDTIQK